MARSDRHVEVDMQTMLVVNLSHCCMAGEQRHDM